MAGELSDNLHTVYMENMPEQASDLAVQQDFVGLIESMRPSVLGDLPDLTPMLSHQRRVSEGLDQQLKVQKNSILLAPGFTDLTGHDTAPQRMAFTPQALLRMGKEDSFKKVFFGALNNFWFTEKNNMSLQVGVKPIPANSVGNVQPRGLHEIAMYQYLASLGLSTLNVVGLALYEEPKNKIAGFLLTEFDPELFTLDSLSWNSMDYQDKISQLGVALDTLAALHSRLLFHGDALFRNIGRGKVPENIKIVDLEFAVSARDIPDDLEAVKGQMAADLACVATSVYDFIFTDEEDRNALTENASLRFNTLYELVYYPYFLRLLAQNSMYENTLVQAFNLFCEQRAKEVESEIAA